MSNHYSENFKSTIVQHYLSGTTSVQLCTKYGIARSTLFLWVKQYSVNADGEVPIERYLLEKELKRLRTENAIFKACDCSPSSLLSERLSAICKHKDKFSIHALCRVLNVNRSTYYHYALRSPEKAQIQLQDDKLKPLIGVIFEKSCGRFGARKIRVKLAEQGHIVSERRILRLMKELGLSAAGAKPRLMQISSPVPGRVEKHNSGRPSASLGEKSSCSVWMLHSSEFQKWICNSQSSTTISLCSNPSHQPSEACPVINSFKVSISVSDNSPATRHSATPQSSPPRLSTVNTAEWTFVLTLSGLWYQCMMPRSVSSGIRFFTSAAVI